MVRNSSNCWIERFADQSPVRVADLREGLANADLVLGASSTAEPVITPDLLPDNRPVVICDVSTPPDTHPRVLHMPNISAIGGGLVQLPCNPDFSIGGIPLPPGQVYACMAETMILTLSGINEKLQLRSDRSEQGT